MENKRVFDDFPKVDCNECERWWMNQCDGADKGTTMRCNSFLATRSVIIPAKIERLTVTVKMLVWAVCALSASVILHHLSILFGW